MSHEPGKNLTRLTHSKKLWEETFDAISDLVMIIGNDHKIVNANRALADKVGLKREEIIGMPCYKIIHGTDRQPDYCPHVKTHSEKKTAHSFLWNCQFRLSISKGNGIPWAPSAILPRESIWKTGSARPP